MEISGRHALNRIPGVLGISAHGFSIGGDKGLVVDWLVVMHRLDERAMLEHAIAVRRIARWQLDQLAEALVHVYRRAVPPFVTAERHLVHWRQSLSDNRRVLLDARACGSRRDSSNAFTKSYAAFSRSDLTFSPQECAKGILLVDTTTRARSMFGWTTP
jgi:aminoglycoside phosphotransferase family enzyme